MVHIRVDRYEVTTSYPQAKLYDVPLEGASL